MSLTAVRWFTISMCLLAFAGRLLVTFWALPLSWRIDSSAVGFAAGLAAIAASVAVPLLLYARVTSQIRRPAVLGVDGTARRFVVPSSPFSQGLQAIFTAWAGASALMTERVPDTDRMRFAQFSGAVAFSVVIMVLTVALVAFLVFLKFPYLTLDPAGLTVRWLAQRTEVRWDELLPGGPPPPAKRGYFSEITLYLRRPGPAGVVPSATVPVGRLGVSPEFLAATIRHYADRPEGRPDIGTDAELTRLRAALGT